MPSAALTPFAFDDALVRVYADDQGEPWFVAKDVCLVLELGKARDAVARLDEDEKGRPVVVDTLGGKQEVATVSESGLYSLIFRSRKPEARRFRKWVTSEVLPAIRRAGAYAAPGEEALPLPESATRLKPVLRGQALHAAVQAAKMSPQGTEADVERLFLRYCSWLSSGPARESEGEDARPDQAEVDFALFQDWADACLDALPATPDGPRPRIQSKAAYHAYRQWCRNAGVRPVSNVWFGRWMRGRFDAHDSNVVWYFCTLKTGASEEHV